MMVKTRIFEFSNSGYKNLSELAQAMGISVSQIYRVREGKRHINQKFIVGAIEAFPTHKLDDLFYLTPESTTVTKDEPAAKEKQIVKSTQHALERFAPAREEYGQHLKSYTSATISQ